jgi:hypothetical protein
LADDVPPIVAHSTSNAKRSGAVQVKVKERREKNHVSSDASVRQRPQQQQQQQQREKQPQQQKQQQQKQAHPQSCIENTCMDDQKQELDVLVRTMHVDVSTSRQSRSSLERRLISASCYRN